MQRFSKHTQRTTCPSSVLGVGRQNTRVRNSVLGVKFEWSSDIRKIYMPHNEVDNMAWTQHRGLHWQKYRGISITQYSVTHILKA